MCISEQKLNTKSTLIETCCAFKRGKGIKNLRDTKQHSRDRFPDNRN